MNDLQNKIEELQRVQIFSYKYGDVLVEILTLMASELSDMKDAIEGLRIDKADIDNYTYCKEFIKDYHEFAKGVIDRLDKSE